MTPKSQMNQDKTLLDRIVTTLWTAPDIDTALKDAESDLRAYGDLTVFCAGVLGDDDKAVEWLTSDRMEPKPITSLVRYYTEAEGYWVALETRILQGAGVISEGVEHRSGGLYHYRSRNKGFRRVFLVFLSREAQSPVVSRLLGADLFYQGLVRALLAKDTGDPRFFFGRSLAMQNLKRQVEGIAADPGVRIVLLEGPSGSGKTTLSRYLVERSLVWSQPYRHARCHSMDPENFAKWLFGVEAGHFTGVNRAEGLIPLTNHGSLFLDDIHSLNLECQDVLRTVVEDRYYSPHGSSEQRPFQLRWIFASAENLDELQKAGRIRRDLHTRLRSGAVIKLSPLDKWTETDRADLFVALWRELSWGQGEARLARFAKDLSKLLLALRFPGNIRQVRALLEGTLSRVRGTQQSVWLGSSEKEAGILWAQCRDALEEMISETGLVSDKDEIGRGPKAVIKAPKAPEEVRPEIEVASWYARAAFRACGKNKTETARRLGISSPTLARRLKEPAAQDAPEKSE